MLVDVVLGEIRLAKAADNHGPFFTMRLMPGRRDRSFLRACAHGGPPTAVSAGRSLDTNPEFAGCLRLVLFLVNNVRVVV